ncbi:MAG: hypothetical protein QOD65_2761 [Gaiellales bacterium]|nr:hypothetical protein [Gaiellales bacterium]MDX6597888.1 hypothetical protein [Gaiellales bacterium]
MRRGNIAVCALVALATFGAGSAQAAKPLRQLSQAQVSLLTAINSARAAAGVAPLRASASLTNAASWQSRSLARAGYLDHTAPDGSTLVQRLQRVGWSGTTAGEDLAVAGAPGEAVTMWLQSPGHRENLLRSSFRTVGLGLARGVWNGREALYVTADFGS